MITEPWIAQKRQKDYEDWAANSKLKLEMLKDRLTHEGRTLESAGRYTDDISTIMQLAWEMHFVATTDVKAIEWAAEDYADLNRSGILTSLRTKIKLRLKK